MAPLAVDNEKFYIYASTAEKQQDPKLVINKDTTSDEFVAELLNKVIIVTKRPSEPAFDATFHQDDEWAKWLKVLNKDGKFSLTMAKDKAEIDHFELAFQDPIALKFSSTKSALINAFGDDAKDIRAPGYDSQELCAGLIKPNDSPDGEVELEKVWKFAGLLPTMLPTVLQNLKVGMDWSLPQKHRNALWFNPGFGSQLTIRLAMHLASVDTLNTLIHSDWLKMSITKAEVVAKKVVTAADTGKRKLAVNEGDALLGLGCKLNKDLELTGCAQFSDGLIKFTLQTDTTDAVAKIIAWLGDVIWGQDDKLKEMEKLLHTEPCESITFRRFQLTLDTSGSKPRVQSFRVDVQAATVIGQDPSKSNKTLFRISYTWSNMPGIDSLGTIRGQLWEPTADSSLADPTYEEWTDFQPVPKGTSTPPIDLTYLIPGHKIESIPATIPSKITRAFISLSTKNVSIGATIKANKVEAGSVPQPYLGEVKLDASFTRGEKKEFNFEFYVLAGIQPSTASTHSLPAVLTGDLIFKRTS